MDTKIFVRLTIAALVLFQTSSCKVKDSSNYELPQSGSPSDLKATRVSLRDLKEPSILYISLEGREESANQPKLNLGGKFSADGITPSKLDTTFKIDTKNIMYSFLSVKDLEAFRRSSKTNWNDVVDARSQLIPDGRNIVEDYGKSKIVNYNDPQISVYSRQSFELLQEMLAHPALRVKTLDVSNVMKASVYAGISPDQLSDLVKDINASTVKGIYVDVSSDRSIRPESIAVNLPIIAQAEIDAFTLKGGELNPELISALAANRSISHLNLQVGRMGANSVKVFTDNPNLKSFTIGVDGEFRAPDWHVMGSHIVLEPETMDAVIDTITRNKNLTSIGFPGRGVHESVIERLARTVKESNITELDLRGSLFSRLRHINDSRSTYLALSDIGKLTRLDLSGSALDYSLSEFMSGLGAVINGNPKLKELNLRDLGFHGGMPGDSVRKFQHHRVDISGLRALAADTQHHSPYTIDITPSARALDSDEIRHLQETMQLYPNVVIKGVPSL